MADKILVTYASRSGSTAGVAEAIAHTLSEQGIPVDVRPMTDVQDILSYRAVIAGSAIQVDKWLPGARQFIEQHQAELASKPVATFSLCMALARSRDEKTRATVSSWVQPIHSMVTPVSEGYFAGVLNVSKIPSFPVRLFARFGILIGFWQEGDYRDWEAIRQWTNTLPEKLQLESSIQEYA